MIVFDDSDKIDWNKVGRDNVTRIKFVIPVGNSNRKWWQFWKKKGITTKETQEEITKLISDYKEVINWDDESGTCNINGNKQIPYSKEYWLPSPDENGKLIKKITKL